MIWSRFFEAQCIIMNSLRNWIALGWYILTKCGKCINMMCASDKNNVSLDYTVPCYHYYVVFCYYNLSDIHTECVNYVNFVGRNAAW